jgi:Undecaprenyl-phosphate galactose phosphotransferase WbaP
MPSHHPFVFQSVSDTRRQLATIVCGLFLVVADFIAWLVAYQIVSPASQMAATKFVIMAAAWCAWAGLVRKQYTRRHSFWTELGLVFQGIFMLAFVGSMLKALIGNADSMPAWLAACAALAVALPLFRWFARSALRKLRLWSWPTLVFGCGENAQQAVLALRDEAAMGYAVAGLVVPSGIASNSRVVALGLPLSAWPGAAEDFARLRGYHCVIALEANESELRDKLIRQLSQHQVVHVHVVPAMRGVPLFGLASTNFFSHEVLMIHIKNRLSHAGLRFIKRCFDIVGSTLLLGLLSPLFVYLAYKVSRDGSGPFFGHERVGQGGKKFYCYKFRSMIVNAQEVLADLLAKDAQAKVEWEKDFKLKNDPRINSVGHFLRRTSLDELPQLWNVLMGDMSLVGPRPVVQPELGRYNEDVVYYLMVKPGMTGLWQVSGRNDVDYETRVYFDSWYVKNWTFLMDLRIMFKTVEVVLGKKGAY